MSIGVYKIVNKVNSKFYIGSTADSFNKRWCLHLFHLRNNKHKNSHLQYSWNKHGEDCFEFIIIEECDNKDMVLDREQYYIDREDFEKLYNINPYATGGLQFSEESIKKRTETNRVLNKRLSERYKLWKDGILLDENLSKRELDRFNQWVNHSPWNKGKKYESTDHLKVPKSKKGSRVNFIKKMIEKMPEISVFGLDGVHINDFKNTNELEKYSETPDCNLPIVTKSKTKKLVVYHINKSCRLGNPYKGLYFKYKEKLNCPPQ